MTVSTFASAYKGVAHGNLNWDTQLRTDFTSLETYLAQQTWTPTLGGTGATVGNDAGGNGGSISRLGTKITASGIIGFGSSASWGSGAAVVGGLNVYGSLDTNLSMGYGWYISGSARTRILLTPSDGTQFFIHPSNTDPLAAAYSLGTPAQGSVLHFTIDGWLA